MFKEKQQIGGLFSVAFNNLYFLDLNWKNILRADPPINKVWIHGKKCKGISSQSGKVFATSSNNISGGSAFWNLRRQRGNILIMKIRNCVKHVCEHKPSFDASRNYIGGTYPNIDVNSS